MQEHSPALVEEEEKEGVHEGKTLRGTEMGGTMDLRETEKKQGIKLQMKQKQTRSPKKRRSLR